MAREDEALAALGAVKDAELERARADLSRLEREHENAVAIGGRAAAELERWTSACERTRTEERARVERGEASGRDLADGAAWSASAEARTNALVTRLGDARDRVVEAERARSAAQSRVAKALAAQEVIRERRAERRRVGARQESARRDDEAEELWAASPRVAGHGEES